MDIRLTPEEEAIVTAELRSGNFRTAEEVIAEALRAFRDNGPARPAVAQDGEQHDAVAEMLRFVEANRVRLEGISVKELLHEGHHL